MTEEKKNKILMDIIQKNLIYDVNRVIEDENFSKYQHILMCGILTDGVKGLVLKHGYDPVNEVFAELLYETAANSYVDDLIRDLRSGYDKDPEFAGKELERMSQVCDEAAHVLEVLK